MMTDTNFSAASVTTKTFRLITVSLMVGLLVGCGLAQQKKWATAEAQAEQQWQQCRARFSTGEFTYSEYADCSDKNAVSILDAAQHPSASGAYQVNAFRRVLGEKINKKQITKSEASLLEAEYIAKLEAEYEQQAYQRSMIEAEQSRALRQAGAALLQSSAPQPVINCNTHYGAYNSSTTCQ